MLFKPSESRFCRGFAAARDLVVLRVLDSVRSQLLPFRYTAGGIWEEASGAAKSGELLDLDAWPVDPLRSDAVWVQRTGFTQPPSLYLAESAANLGEATLVKAQPALFNTAGLVVEQRWAMSKDSTHVP